MVPSDKYSYFIYGYVKNTNNSAAIILLLYFTSASITSGKYYCLLYSTFNKIYILHRPPPILLPSAMVHSENIVIPLTSIEKITSMLFQRCFHNPGKILLPSFRTPLEKYTYFTVCHLYYCLLLWYLWKNIVIPTMGT
jgi:hypothetical protein